MITVIFISIDHLYLQRFKFPVLFIVTGLILAEIQHLIIDHHILHILRFKGKNYAKLD